MDFRYFSVNRSSKRWAGLWSNMAMKIPWCVVWKANENWHEGGRYDGLCIGWTYRRCTYRKLPYNCYLKGLPTSNTVQGSTQLYCNIAIPTPSRPAQFVYSVLNSVLTLARSQLSEREYHFYSRLLHNAFMKLTIKQLIPPKGFY